MIHLPGLPYGDPGPLPMWLFEQCKAYVDAKGR